MKALVVYLLVAMIISLVVEKIGGDTKAFQRQVSSKDRRAL